MQNLKIVILALLWSLSSLAHSEARTSSKNSDSPRSSMRMKARNKPSESTASSVSVEKRASKSDYLNYLPFGTGQFAQKKFVSGIVFGTTQALSLGGLYFASENVKKANADVDAVMGSTDKATAASDPAALAYLDKNEKYVKEYQTNMTIFTGIFLLSYGVSVIDAVFDPFGSFSLAAKKRRVSENEGSRKKSGHGSMTSENIEDVRDSRLSFFTYKGEEKPGYGLQLTSDF